MTASVTRYCLCGGAMSGRAHPAEHAAGLVAAFEVLHAGVGHGPATPVQAARARRREEARLLREEVGR